MAHRWVQGLVAATLVAAAWPVQAQTVSGAMEWLSTDTYMGGNTGWQSSSASVGNVRRELGTIAEIDVLRVDDGGVPWRLYFGKQLRDQVALELGFVELGHINVTVDAGAADPDAYLQRLAVATPAAPSGVVLDLVATTFLAPESNVYLIARGGLFAWRTDVSYSTGTAVFRHKDDGVDPHVGVGAGFRLTERLDARVEWEWFGSRTSVHMTTVGLLFRF